jgi:hypothetical protein
LKGQALSYFEHHLMKRLEAKYSDVPDNELIELVLSDIGLEYISKHAICMQKYFMRRGLYMGLNTSVQKFVERLNDINRYLLYFPEENLKQLNQDEIIEILDQAKPRNGILNDMKRWLMPTMKFLKCLMRNKFLISIVWRTWRRSGAPTVQILLHYQ